MIARGVMGIGGLALVLAEIGGGCLVTPDDWALLPAVSGLGTGANVTGTGDTGSTSSGEACTPGAQAACFCPGGGNGGSACNEGGTGWGPCLGCPGGGGPDLVPWCATEEDAERCPEGYDGAQIIGAPTGCGGGGCSLPGQQYLCLRRGFYMSRGSCDLATACAGGLHLIGSAPACDCGGADFYICAGP